MAPEHKLRVIAPDVGGGFGSKIFIYPEEVVCLWAAKKVGRPVKWVSERSEAFLATPMGATMSPAPRWLRADGKIAAVRVKTIANIGAYMSTFSLVGADLSLRHLLSGQYDIPHIYCEVDAVYTNTAPVVAHRGAGRPEATFVVERLIEVSARQLAIAPTELRRRNFIDTFPHQTPVIMNYDAGDYDASLAKALELADFKNFARRRRESSVTASCAGSASPPTSRPAALRRVRRSARSVLVAWRESAEVRVNPAGSVEVLTGSTAMARASDNDVAQVVAGRLGIPIENISVIHGDTDKVQFGWYDGSRSGAVGMSAIEGSARQGRGQGQEGRVPIRRRRPTPTSCSRTAASQWRAPTSPWRGAMSRCTPTSPTSSPGPSRASRKGRSTIRPISPSPPVATSARSRSIRTRRHPHRQLGCGR